MALCQWPCFQGAHLMPTHKGTSGVACWADSRMLTLRELQSLAASKGGTCLSPGYVGAQESMKWRCSRGSEWSATASDIRRGGWCPRCHFDTRRLTLVEMHDLAAALGGVCLSQEYRNSLSNLRWRCQEGHEWEAQAGNVKAGHWCQECARESMKLTIATANDYATNHGGVCLSKEYVDSRSPLTWRCKEGHVFHAPLGNLRASGRLVRQMCWECTHHDCRYACDRR